MEREFIIDGDVFSDIDGFYDEIKNVFTSDIHFRLGRNLNAFNDVLRGGFGMHHYGEPITIVWKSFERSRKLLGDAFVLTVIEVILDNDESGHDCRLYLRRD